MMIMTRPGYTDIDSYIRSFPPDIQKKLEQLRATIRKAAPEAEEVISYNMPAFRYHGILVYFAGYKNHIGFYPAASGIKAFQMELSGFKYSKGAIQFPIDKPVPLRLISKIVKFRVNELLNKNKPK